MADVANQPLDLSELTEEERLQLIVVMKKAQEFELSEEKLLMRQPLEGQLFKYTNVMKGWQYRWFVLNPEAGRLEYYEKEDHKKLQRPRGCLLLAGASVFPSEEDSQTFSINASNGDSYRLKAFDAKERQHWVNRLRATAEYHMESTSCNVPRVSSSSTISSNLQQSNTLNKESNFVDNLFGNSSGLFSRPRQKPEVIAGGGGTPGGPHSTGALVTGDSSDNHVESSLKTCIDSLSVIRRLHKDLVCHIETLPLSGECISRLDKELLLLKATSTATLNCLEQCLSVLQRQVATSNCTLGGTAVNDASESTRCLGGAPVSHAVTQANNRNNSDPSITAYTHASNGSQHVSRICRSDEVEDRCVYTDTDVDVVDEHKNVILHLLSQLKLGMDLTKVVLPTFILEKRSLLEMFADCMAHPELFLRISDAPTAEARMLAVVEWYVLSFHAARQGSIAKKPYNPIIGECFHCSWTVSDTDIKNLESHVKASEQQQPQPAAVASDSSSSRSQLQQTSDKSHCLSFCAEQVSHHPPISAFYFECPSKQLSMEASIWTRSKFMGMSIGVAMIGKVRLRVVLPDGETEDYEFSLPSVFARSILTIPWVELGDKVTVQCDRTRYTAGIVFHTKPFYGGRLHRISGEVKSSNGETYCRVNGEWNGVLEFISSNGQVRSLDTSKLPVRRKRVRPLDLQGVNESRRLWRHVTESLQLNDIEKATEHKRVLEDGQRENERIRREARLPFPTKYFQQSGDEWIFKTPFQPTTQNEALA